MIPLLLLLTSCLLACLLPLDAPFNLDRTSQEVDDFRGSNLFQVQQLYVVRPASVVLCCC
jgi:hypothetical protein